MDDSSPKPGIDWPIGPGPVPALVVAGLSVCALGACFHNALAWPAQVLLAAGVILVGGRAVLRLYRPRSTGLHVDGDRIRVLVNDRMRSGVVAGQPFVSPVFVGLRWRERGRRMPHSLGVFRSQMTEHSFRRLSSALRNRSVA